jgi:type IV secretion system protein VirB1
LVLDNALIEHCAPSVAPATILKIIKTESGGDAYALHVNGYGRLPSSGLAAAHRYAQIAIEAGYSVDIGLMQINSQHLKRFHLTIQQALEPCTNLRVGSILLTASYLEAARIFGRGQVALQHALSAYNTGDFQRGLDNGYVAQYYFSRGASTRRRQAAHVDIDWSISASASAPSTME